MVKWSPCLDILPPHLHYDYDNDDDEIKMIFKKSKPSNCTQHQKHLFILVMSLRWWPSLDICVCIQLCICSDQHVNILTLISGLLFFFSAPLWENQTALSRWALIGPAREVTQIAIPAVINVFVSIFCLISFVMLLWQMVQLPETFSALWRSFPYAFETCQR